MLGIRVCETKSLISWNSLKSLHQGRGQSQVGNKVSAIIKSLDMSLYTEKRK